MRLFGRLYDTALRWSSHRHAPRYLGVLSFTESSFFPIPPDVMLAPMVLARPERTWWLATLTTVTSVLGGVFGYFIGALLFSEIGRPLIELYHAEAAFERVQQWFADYGVWVVLLAGFSPIPYKLFTITSGMLSMALAPFVLASCLGRGARFFLVAALLYWGGARFERFLRQRIDLIGWSAVVAVVIAYLAFT